MTERTDRILESLSLAQKYEDQDYDQLATDIRLSVTDELKSLNEEDRKVLLDSLKSEK